MPKRYPIGMMLALLLLVALVYGYTLPPPAAAQIPPTFTLLPTATPFLPTAIPNTPTPIPTPGCITPLPLTEGQTAYVSGGVNVRYEPSLSSPLVNNYSQATIVTVVSGPVCANNFNWWQVRGPGNDGWVAEGYPDKYFIQVGPPAPGAAVCDPPLNFAVGEQVRLARSLRVRGAPSAAGLVLTVAPAGALVQIVDTPICAEGYNWWLVRVTVANVTYSGRIAEGQPGGSAWMESPLAPPPVCAPPLPLAVGSRAYVNYNDHRLKHLRAQPGLNGTILLRLLDGIGFEVIGGPACVDSYNWWHIRILTTDITGWLSEGGPPAYWIQFNRLFDR